MAAHLEHPGSPDGAASILEGDVVVQQGGVDPPRGLQHEARQQRAGLAWRHHQRQAMHVCLGKFGGLKHNEAANELMGLE